MTITSRVSQVLRLGSSRYVVDALDALLSLLECVEASIRAGAENAPDVVTMAQLARECVEAMELSMGDETDEERAVRDFEAGK